MPQFEIETAGPSDEQDRPSGLMALTFPDLSRPPVEITWDVPTSELAHQVAALMKQADRLANYAQGLPSRREYEATLSDVDALQQQVAILFDVQKAQAQTINDLLAVVQTLHSRERAA